MGGWVPDGRVGTRWEGGYQMGGGSQMGGWVPDGRVGARWEGGCQMGGWVPDGRVGARWEGGCQMGGGSQIGRCHVGKDKLITHHSCFKDRTIYGQTGKTVCAHQLFATGSKILM